MPSVFWYILYNPPTYFIYRLTLSRSDINKIQHTYSEKKEKLVKKNTFGYISFIAVFSDALPASPSHNGTDNKEEFYEHTVTYISQVRETIYSAVWFNPVYSALDCIYGPSGPTGQDLGSYHEFVSNVPHFTHICVSVGGFVSRDLWRHLWPIVVTDHVRGQAVVAVSVYAVASFGREM